MALKSFTIVLLVAAACLAAPAEDEAPAPVPQTAAEEGPTTEHLHPDLDSILEHFGQAAGERRRRATDDQVCGKKSGQKATCVPYYLCKTSTGNSQDEDIGPECSSYVETCCLESERVVDLNQLVDIQ